MEIVMMRGRRWACCLVFGVLALCLDNSVAVSAQKLKVSCVGNSITYGYEFANPTTQSYPGQLQALLGTANYDVGNFGDSGRSLLQGSGYSYWDSQRYTAALASNPDYVVLKLGTNDTKRWLWNWLGANFKKDYKDMVFSFQGLTSKPEMWICMLIPSENTGWEIYKSDINGKVNPKIKEIALEMGLNMIDLYAELDKNMPSWYLVDGVHPSVTGAGIIAQKVQEMLLMPKPEVTFANGKVIAPDGDGFQWYKDGVPVSVQNGGNLKEMTVAQPGFYKVSVKLSASSETRIVSKELSVSVTTVATAASTSAEMKLYPNPASTVIHVVVNGLKTNEVYRIVDMSGATVLSDKISNGKTEIGISRLSAGIYTLVVGDENVSFVKN